MLIRLGFRGPEVETYFDTYEIHWANPKAHRMFFIKCVNCQGACFGAWAQYEQGATEPEADEAARREGKRALQAVAALQHFVNYQEPAQLAVPSPPPEATSA